MCTSYITLVPSGIVGHRGLHVHFLWDAPIKVDASDPTRLPLNLSRHFHTWNFHVTFPSPSPAPFPHHLCTSRRADIRGQLLPLSGGIVVSPSMDSFIQNDEEAKNRVRQAAEFLDPRTRATASHLLFTR